MSKAICKNCHAPLWGCVAPKKIQCPSCGKCYCKKCSVKKNGFVTRYFSVCCGLELTNFQLARTHQYRQL